MNLKPLLFVAGAAGAVAAAAKSRAGRSQISQAASSVGSAAPAPVEQAVQSATETVQRVAQNAPGPIQKAVDKVAPETGEGDQPRERYAPPIEAGAQPPATPGGPPSSDTTAIQAPRVASEPGDALNVPEHGLPEDVVMPDTSADDPLVREATNAAAADAGSIGGNVDELAAADPSFPTDPAMRPMIEGAGDENEETFETRETAERSNRETEL